PAAGGDAYQLTESGDCTAPVWSPDGQFLAYANGTTDGIWVATATGERAHQVAAAPPGWRDATPRFSPDGRQIAFAIHAPGPYGELAVVSLSGGKPTHLTNDGAFATSPAWSPDGRQIFFASSRGGTMNLWRISARGGSATQITAGQGDDAQLDVDATGQRIVFATWHLKLSIAQMNLEPGAPAGLTWLTADPGRNQIEPTYSPDGKHIAFFSNLKGAEHESVWVEDFDGTHARTLAHDDQLDLFPRWTPDSLHLIFQAESAVNNPSQYREVSIAGGAPTTIGGGGRDRYFDVGADGRMLYRDSSGAVTALDPATGQTSRLGMAPSSVVHAPLRWSPDQRAVAYIVQARRADDPDAGLWVTDFKNPPRQLFRGWVDWWLARGPQGMLYFLQAKPDLNAVLWKVDWNGQGLARAASGVPMTFSFWADPAMNTQDYFDVSPDGKHLATTAQNDVSASLGMLQRVR
ncbi:MAG: TolB family protein, partial [Terriglobales bacterium]